LTNKDAFSYGHCLELAGARLILTLGILPIQPGFRPVPNSGNFYKIDIQRDHDSSAGPNYQIDKHIDAWFLKRWPDTTHLPARATDVLPLSE
jgi:hypothetical protein